MCETGGSDCANSITVGTTRPISVASCSGPLGIGGPSPPPASATADRASSTRRGWNGVGSAPKTRCGATVQPNRAAAASHASRHSPSIRARTSASRWRRSSIISHSPAIAVITPGVLRMLPTVVTPSWRMPTSRISSAALEAAASASRRRRIGVEPACAAWPLKWIR